MRYQLFGRMIAACLITGAVSGCGGGGSNDPGGAVGPAATATLSGTVLDGSGNALPGYEVVYDLLVVNDPNAALSVTTDAAGHYSLTVPVRDITGHDTLSFLDTFGNLAASQAVTPGMGTSVLPTTTINLAPPMPAPLVIKK